jgi:hypothetical protein
MMTILTLLSCVDNEIVTYTATVEFDGKVYSDTTDEIMLEAMLGHCYGDPTWDWAEDYSSATATFTCERGDDEQVLYAFADVNIISEMSCTTDEVVTYTATVEFNGQDYSDTTDPVTLNCATGHDFGEWVEYDENDHICSCVRCGETVTEPHAFTAWTPNAAGDEESRTCSLCGRTETRAVSQPAQTLRLAMNASGTFNHPGDTVEVTVDLTENPGVVGLALKLSYDPDALTLTDVQGSGLLLNGNFTPGNDYAAAPYKLLWEDALAENYYDTGKILTFTFTVNEDAAPGTTTVTLLPDVYAALDHDLNEVPISISGTDVRVVLHVPGDSDGDGVVDLKDAIELSRYLAGGWDVDVDTRNCDVDGDGKLSLRDIVLIRRYLAGWEDVELV